MQSKRVSAPLALFAAVAGLAVLTAGCIAQDRPHEPTYTVVADAGGAVVEVGHAAHLEWSEHDAVEVAEGGHLEEQPEIEWKASNGEHAEGANFSVTPHEVGLTLVELNVTVEHHSALDIGGVLTIPSGAFAAGAFIGVVGHIELSGTGLSSPLLHQTATMGSHPGHYYFAPGSNATLRLPILQGAEGGEASFLIAVKRAGGGFTSAVTPALPFEGGLSYTLVVDTTHANDHKIEARGGLFDENLELGAFAEAHGGESETRVLVAPPGQKLSGAGAAAAVASFAGLALLAALRRRR